MQDLEAQKYQASDDMMDTGDSKKTKSDQDKPTNTSASNNSANISSLNLPISKEKGQAAIVKLYNVDEGAFKVNDMFEFIGIVSLSPLLANAGADMDDNDILVQFNKPELDAKNPPASLIPRLHVVKHTKLSHNNPQLPRDLATKNVAWEELRRSVIFLRLSKTSSNFNLVLSKLSNTCTYIQCF